MIIKFGPTRVLFRALTLGLPLVLALALVLALVLALALEAGRTPPLLGASKCRALLHRDSGSTSTTLQGIGLAHLHELGKRQFALLRRVRNHYPQLLLVVVLLHSERHEVLKIVSRDGRIPGSMRDRCSFISTR